jgi:two-component system chemotaxis sensor kinase CheA
LQNVIVVSAASLRVGLAVDRILGTNQTVVKQMSRLHAGVKSISGATILGDGSVALVLEVGNLVELARTDLRKIEKAA